MPLDVTPELRPVSVLVLTGASPVIFSCGGHSVTPASSSASKDCQHSPIGWVATQVLGTA